MFILTITTIVFVCFSCNQTSDEKRFEGRWRVIEFLANDKSEMNDVSGGKGFFLWDFQKNNTSYMYGDKSDGFYGELKWELIKRKNSIEIYSVEYNIKLLLTYYFLDDNNLTLKGRMNGHDITFFLKRDLSIN